MLVTRLIESLHQAHVTFLDDLLSIGIQRSRTVYRSPLLNPNTLLLDLAALSFSEWSKLSRIMASTWSMCPFTHNLVQHSKTKHIQIRHHFLRDHVLKEDIDIIHVNTEEQLADIFTNPLYENRFRKLRCELSILESSNVLWMDTHPNAYACWWLCCATHEVTYVFKSWRHTL